MRRPASPLSVLSKGGVPRRPRARAPRLQAESHSLVDGGSWLEGALLSESPKACSGGLPETDRCGRTSRRRRNPLNRGLAKGSKPGLFGRRPAGLLVFERSNDFPTPATRREMGAYPPRRVTETPETSAALRPGLRPPRRVYNTRDTGMPSSRRQQSRCVFTSRTSW
jgi:hypothetical protein